MPCTVGHLALSTTGEVVDKSMKCPKYVTIGNSSFCLVLVLSQNFHSCLSVSHYRGYTL